MKQKLQLFINPLSNMKDKPIDITIITEAIDYISSKFIIDNINIQLNEYNRPSELYCDLLFGVCKTITKKIKVDNYLGVRRNNISKTNPVNNVILIIDNKDIFTFIIDNNKHIFSDIESFSQFLLDY